MHAPFAGSHEGVLQSLGEHLASSRGHQVTQVVWKEVGRSLKKSTNITMIELPMNFKQIWGFRNQHNYLPKFDFSYLSLFRLSFNNML